MLQQAAFQERPLYTVDHKDNCSRHPIPHRIHLSLHSSSKDSPAEEAGPAAAGHRAVAECLFQLHIKKKKQWNLVLPHLQYYQT